jgi:site-specific DNA recombinase
MLVCLFGAIAQYDKAMLVAKLRGARQRMKARTGRCEGRKAYGHTEQEQAVIARMRQMRESGMSYRAIADALNSQGVPARKAAKWHTTQVQRILA